MFRYSPCNRIISFIQFRHCTKKVCANNDVACGQEKRKSIRWYGQGFPNNVGPGALQFTYSISARGELLRFQILVMY